MCDARLREGWLCDSPQEAWGRPRDVKMLLLLRPHSAAAFQPVLPSLPPWVLPTRTIWRPPFHPPPCPRFSPNLLQSLPGVRVT